MTEELTKLVAQIVKQTMDKVADSGMQGMSKQDRLQSQKEQEIIDLKRLNNGRNLTPAQWHDLTVRYRELGLEEEITGGEPIFKDEPKEDGDEQE